MSAILEWALVDGHPKHAAGFVGVPPDERPAAVCPCCGEQVVWKAGEKGLVTPHVAHVPGALCPSSNSETAEHLNAKLKLVNVLSVRQWIDLRVKCLARPLAPHWMTQRWTFGHDEVQPEYRVGSRRPDVALLAGGIVVGAIEVRVTHAVDTVKAGDLAALGVWWVEVDALGVLAWDGERPLLALNGGAEVVDHRGECIECEELKQRVRADRIRREQERAAERLELQQMHEHQRIAREYLAARDARRVQVERLRRDPPALHLAVAVAMEGNPGTACIGFVVMREGHRPSPPCMIDGEVGSGTAAWLALEHALQWLEARAPGRAATIHTNLSSVAAVANAVRVQGDDDFRASVCDAVARTGSLVVWTPTRSGSDPDAAWILRLHKYLSLALERAMS